MNLSTITLRYFSRKAASERNKKKKKKDKEEGDLDIDRFSLESGSDSDMDFAGYGNVACVLLLGALQ